MAIKKFQEMLIAQGVKQDIAEALCKKNANPYQYIPLAPQSHEFKAQKTGMVTDIDALQFATVCGNLGAGRQKVTDKVDHGVGIVLNVRVRDYVKEGEVLGKIYHSGHLVTDAINSLQESITIDVKQNGESLPIKSRLIEVVDGHHTTSGIFVGQ